MIRRANVITSAVTIALLIGCGSDTAIDSAGNDAADGVARSLTATGTTMAPSSTTVSPTDPESSTTSTTEHWNKGEACGVAPEDWSTPVIEGENVHCTIACGDTVHPSIDCLWPDGNHRWPGTPGIRGSNGYCVSELQAASMPDQTICLEPEEATDFWGSRLMFEFFNDKTGSIAVGENSDLVLVEDHRTSVRAIFR